MVHVYSTMIASVQTEAWVWIVGTAVGMTAIATFWVKVVNPFVAFIAVTKQLADSIPIWQEIASEFKPDHGSSLHDRMETADTLQTTMAVRLSALEAMQAELMHKLDDFIWDRKVGGRRVHDPLKGDTP